MSAPSRSSSSVTPPPPSSTSTSTSTSAPLSGHPHPQPHGAIPWDFESEPSDAYQRQLGGSFIEKCKENPLLPIGLGATAAMLGGGLWSFFQGNSKRSQFFMRGRVLAQGFTIAVISATLYQRSLRDRARAEHDAARDAATVHQYQMEQAAAAAAQQKQK